MKPRHIFWIGLILIIAHSTLFTYLYSRDLIDSQQDVFQGKIKLNLSHFDRYIKQVIQKHKEHPLPIRSLFQAHQQELANKTLKNFGFSETFKIG
jgi:hypothetical protein